MQVPSSVTSNEIVSDKPGHASSILLTIVEAKGFKRASASLCRSSGVESRAHDRPGKNDLRLSMQ